jgi:hypothetical protein
MSAHRRAGHPRSMPLLIAAALIAGCTPAGGNPGQMPDGPTVATAVADAGSAPSGPGDEPAGSEGSGPTGLPDEGTLPIDFPSEIPLPDGYHLVGVLGSSTTDGASGTYFVEFYSELSKDDLLSFYRDRLPSSIGWNETGSEERDGRTFVTFEPAGEQPTDRQPSGLVVQVAESDVDGYRVVNLQIYSYPL